jgi:hypothetical protein
VGAHGVPSLEHPRAAGDDDRTTGFGIGCAPYQGDGVYAALAGVGG